MTEPTDTPDYSELLRSPYDADPKDPGRGRSEGESEVPWKPAVFAAILGALLVSSYVIYALASSPGADEEAVALSTTTTAAPAPVQSTSFPQGYSGVTDTVGARVERVEVYDSGTLIAVSSAVIGGADPAEQPPLDVAYWDLELADGTRDMVSQYTELGVLGSITVEFAPLAVVRSPSLVPVLPEGQIEETVTVDLAPDLPTSITDYRIDLADGHTVVIEALVISEGWGYVTWTTEGDFPAKVETIVRFVGTDDPATADVVDETLLAPQHRRRLAPGSGAIPPGPLYGFTGSEQLYRTGEPLGAGNAPVSIQVEFSVVMPDAVARGAAIEVPASP